MLGMHLSDIDMRAYVKKVNKELGRGEYYDPRDLKLRITAFKMGATTCSGRYMGHYILNTALREHLHSKGVNIKIGTAKSVYHGETNDISFEADLK